ncbi:MAG: zinc metallopeptidase [Deinococcales bacterium]
MYFIVMIVGMALPMLVQAWLRNTYGHWSNVRNTANLSGAEVARAILKANNIHDVEVEAVAGMLSDHYDPRSKKVRLSEGNYGVPSVSAMAVAAHEVGHAIQHAHAYKPLAWRTALLMPAQIGQNIGPLLVIVGASIGALGLAQVGILLFAAAALFQLITLPIEFDASRRALAEMERLGLATSNDSGGSRKVLTAAAMTYVAGLATTVMMLLYYMSIFSRRD